MFFNKRNFTTLVISSLFIFSASAQQKLQIAVGSPDFADWKGVGNLKNNIATIAFNQPISYRYPDGKRYNIGFRGYREDVSDWSQFSGLRFEVFAKDDKAVEFDICLKIPESDVKSYMAETHAHTSVVGKG